MKDGRKIVIKHESLKNIRKNLRRMLSLVIEKRLKNISKSSEMAWKNRYFNGYSPIDEKRRIQLNKEYNDLLNTYHHSILHCSGFCKGDISDKDMIYDSYYDRWFCEDCYHDMQENLDPKRWFNKGIIVNDNAKKPCYNLNWCPYGGLTEAFRIRRKQTKYTCKIFGHDCPVFYISEEITEDSKKFPEQKLSDTVERIRFRHLSKYLRPEFFKPCHELKMCPYGFLCTISKTRNNPNEYTCKLFEKDCPVFYKAEYASENFDKKINSEMSKDLKNFLL